MSPELSVSIQEINFSIQIGSFCRCFKHTSIEPFCRSVDRQFFVVILFKFTLMCIIIKLVNFCIFVVIIENTLIDKRYSVAYLVFLINNVEIAFMYIC